MSRMKAKKRRIMTKVNRKKRLRQAAGHLKELEMLALDRDKALSLEHPSIYTKHDRDVSNY
ncbi:hypothetical protein QR721_11990 [Aciduricibacillus chroicocephali]|uniref:Uncharacterized protein n=1 Tax=Aciduricibacillus chroicocephali TaxID=3054939 RepID=A0ABY9KVP4_9BACI|nr:hypothetical protein QR721_11990 [Bacillaceae bacterium 44XB]